MKKAKNQRLYEHGPLIMALADISFSDLPNFETNFDVEILAESLFDFGFTQKTKEIQQAFEFQIKPSQQNANLSSSDSNTKKVTKTKWAFLNNERTLSLHILSNKLILKCTKYKSFQIFYELLENCINVCEKDIKNFDKIPVQKLGLRYVNLIAAKPEQNLNDYLNKSWHAPTNIVNGTSSQTLMISRSTQIVKDENVVVRVDSAQFNPKSGMQVSLIPNDLADSNETGLQLSFTPWTIDSINNGNNYVVLDIDSSTQEALTCTPKSGLEIFKKLRKPGKAAFENYVTSFAKSQWVEL